MKYTVLALWSGGKWTVAAKMNDRGLAFVCGSHLAKDGMGAQIWEHWTSSKNRKAVHSFNPSTPARNSPAS